MTANKLEKVAEEIGRLERRIASDRARLKELSARKTELENTEILRAFRAVDIPLGDLPGLLRELRRHGAGPGKEAEPDAKE